MERITIISIIIRRIMDIFLTTMVVVIIPSPFTTGDDKRSLFNIVGDCRTTQEPLNNFEYVVSLSFPSLAQSSSKHCQTKVDIFFSQLLYC